MPLEPARRIRNGTPTLPRQGSRVRASSPARALTDGPLEFGSRLAGTTYRKEPHRARLTASHQSCPQRPGSVHLARPRRSADRGTDLPRHRRRRGPSTYRGDAAFPVLSSRLLAEFGVSEAASGDPASPASRPPPRRPDSLNHPYQAPSRRPGCLGCELPAPAGAGAGVSNRADGCPRPRGSGRLRGTAGASPGRPRDPATSRRSALSRHGASERLDGLRDQGPRQAGRR